MKGTVDYLLPGATVWTNVPIGLRFGVPLTTARFNEDGVAGGGANGNAYGYRAFNGCNDAFVDAAGTPNRLTGCFYQGHDFPGISFGAGMPAGTQYRVDMIFLGEAVDVFGTVLSQNQWVVLCQGTI